MYKFSKIENYGLKHQLKEKFGKDDDHVGEAILLNLNPSD